MSFLLVKKMLSWLFTPVMCDSASASRDKRLQTSNIFTATRAVGWIPRPSCAPAVAQRLQKGAMGDSVLPRSNSCRFTSLFWPSPVISEVRVKRVQEETQRRQDVQVDSDAPASSTFSSSFSFPAWGCWLLQEKGLEGIRKKKSD